MSIKIFVFPLLMISTMHLGCAQGQVAAAVPNGSSNELPSNGTSSEPDLSLSGLVDVGLGEISEAGILSTAILPDGL